MVYYDYCSSKELQEGRTNTTQRSTLVRSTPKSSSSFPISIALCERTHDLRVIIVEENRIMSYALHHNSFVHFRIAYSNSRNFGREKSLQKRYFYANSNSYIAGAFCSHIRNRENWRAVKRNFWESFKNCRWVKQVVADPNYRS